MSYLGQLLIIEDRRLELEQPATLGTGREQVALGAERRLDLRHQFLADGVERRVGHLREQLLEVVVQQPRALRQHRQRGVIAHGTQRLFAFRGHRRHQQAQVLVGVTEHLLARAHRGVVRPRNRRRRRQRGQRHQALVQPLLIRLRGGVALLELGVVDDTALARIHEEDTARVQALLDEYVLRRDVEHADLGGHHHEAVLGNVVA